MTGYRASFYHLCTVPAVTSARNVKFLTVDMVSLHIRLMFVVSAVTVSRSDAKQTCNGAGQKRPMVFTMK
jgi:hypothetical protein